MKALVDHDSRRYATLDFPHDSLFWNPIGAIASTCRHAGGGELFPALSTSRRVFATGWSQSGSSLRTYLGERLHDQHTDWQRSSGVPADIYDEYLSGVSSGGFSPMGYLELGRDGEVEFDEDCYPNTTKLHQIPLNDARRTIHHAPVPVIEYMSEDEAVHHVWHRRPDSDDVADRYRRYEVPGRGHETGLLRTSARAGELGADRSATYASADPPEHTGSPVACRRRGESSRALD